ncbi:unnamed protein product [Pedinophyceae sp. YPF-701]|nr:unnamed protein product [Pedinophyceae sp. YPF-701]
MSAAPLNVAAAAGSAALRESILASDTTTARIQEVLQRISNDAKDLAQASVPIKVRMTALSAAHDNIESVRNEAEGILKAIAQARELARRQGTEDLSAATHDPSTLLKRLDEIQTSSKYLEKHLGLKVAKDALAEMSRARTRLLDQCLALTSTELGTFQHPMPLLDLLRAAAAGSDDEDGAAAARGAVARAHPSARALDPAAVEKLRPLVSAMVDAGDERFATVWVQQRRQALETTFEALPWATRQDALSAAVYSLPNAPPEEVDRWAGEAVLAARAMACLAPAEAAAAADVLPYRLAQQSTEALLQKPLAAVGQLARGVAAKAPPSPTKVFGLLAAHEALLVLLEELRKCFGDGEGPVVRTQALVNDVEATARREFESLDGAAVGEGMGAAGPAQTATAAAKVPDASVHPLTANTVTYVRLLFKHGGSLGLLLGDKPPQSPADTPASHRRARSAAEPGRLAVAVRRIMSRLEGELTAVAAQYKSPGKAELFQMTNAAFVLSAVRQCDTRNVLDAGWYEGQRGRVLAYAGKYKDKSWGPLVQRLEAETAEVADLKSFEGRLPDRRRAPIKATYAAFNSGLAKTCAQQARWWVPDGDLRERLRKSVAKQVCEAYARWLEATRGLAFARDTSKSIKHNPQQVHDLVVSQLFEGRSARGAGAAGSRATSVGLTGAGNKPMQVVRAMSAGTKRAAAAMGSALRAASPFRRRDTSASRSSSSVPSSSPRSANGAPARQAWNPHAAAAPLRAPAAEVAETPAAPVRPGSAAPVRPRAANGSAARPGSAQNGTSVLQSGAGNGGDDPGAFQGHGFRFRPSVDADADGVRPMGRPGPPQRPPGAPPAQGAAPGGAAKPFVYVHGAGGSRKQTPSRRNTANSNVSGSARGAVPNSNEAKPTKGGGLAAKLRGISPFRKRPQGDGAGTAELGAGGRAAPPRTGPSMRPAIAAPTNSAGQGPGAPPAARMPLRPGGRAATPQGNGRAAQGAPQTAPQAYTYAHGQPAAPPQQPKAHAYQHGAPSAGQPRPVKRAPPQATRPQGGAGRAAVFGAAQNAREELLGARAAATRTARAARTMAEGLGRVDGELGAARGGFDAEDLT